MKARCQHANDHVKNCRPGRPLCRWRKVLCHCSGVTFNSKRPCPHRLKSKCGKFGVCNYHPDAYAIMESVLKQPVSRASVAGCSYRSSL